MKTKIQIALILLSGIITAQQNKVDSTASIKIDEVKITKKVFQKKSDRFVYDISSAPSAKGNTAFNILKQTPLISSTDDKTLKIIGKNNAVIFINGRKTNMDQESLTQFLKNTPSENIQKIEVITLPGSEYQVESSDGIINIILKKKSTNGLNGNLRMGNTQGFYNSSNASISANYRKDNLAISSSIQMGDENEEQKYLLRNGTSTASNQSEGSWTNPEKYYGGYVNLDYQINENSNVALTWNSNFNKSNNSTFNLFNTVTNESLAEIKETKYNYTKKYENSRRINNSVNLNYELRTDSLGSKLNLNVAYLNYNRNQDSKNYTYNSDIFKNLLGNPIHRIEQNTPQKINNFSFLGDYLMKFKNNLSIAFGANYNKTKTDNDTKNDTYDANSLVNSNPNHFIYDENIYGVFLTLEKKLQRKYLEKQELDMKLQEVQERLIIQKILCQEMV